MAIGIQDQYFGTEIEMTGITRQRAAEVVAEMFGTRAVCDGGYYGVWSVTDQEGKKWKFMYDGSIYTERRGRGAVFEAPWGKGKCILRAACSCGRFQPHPKKPQKCYDYHVFQRGYFVQGIESADFQRK